jgi:hypothetical protein
MVNSGVRFWPKKPGLENGLLTRPRLKPGQARADPRRHHLKPWGFAMLLMILPLVLLFLLCFAFAWSMTGYTAERSNWLARSRLSPRGRPCPMTLNEILGQR